MPADETVSASDLVQISAPLGLYSAWLPPSPRPVGGDAVLHDAGEPVPGQPGGVLLLAGARPSAADTVAAVADAGAHGYSAVIVKARGDNLTELIRAAEDADVALLIAPDNLSWRDLDTVIATLITAQSSGPAYAQVNPGDLFALANAIAYSVGGATAIEDLSGRLFAHSNLPHQDIDDIRLRSITDRQTPSRDADIARYLQVRNSTKPQRFQSDEAQYASRLAISVRAGDQLLGTIWVLDGDPPLGPGAEQALEDAARVAALHLLQIRRQEDARRWNRAEVLGSLLSGGIGASTAAALIGIPVSTPTGVLAIAPDSTTEPAALGAERTVDLVNLYCEAWHPQALSTALDGVIFAVLPIRTEGSGSRHLVRFARDVANTVQRTVGLTLRVGIGPIAERLDDVPACRRLAVLALDAISPGGAEDQVATVEDMRSRVILRELATRGVLDLDLPGDPVQQIRDHDREHDTTYAESLLAYLDAFGDASRAAKVLCVHENTLRYRMRRVQEMFPLDLDDPNTRLVTWLQLRLPVL